MIPQTIHYCWFGNNPKDSFIKKNIESWRKFLPNAQIKEWNELNFNIEFNTYTSEAYKAKKYAFVSDVVRLYALVSEGGVYFDTDVTALQSFPPELFKTKAFAGFETDKTIGTGILACQKEHPFFKEFLDSYNKRHFDLFLKKDTTSNVEEITRLLKKNGLIANNKRQNVSGIEIFPKEIFCNKNYKTGERYISKQSLTIHDFQGSWTEKSLVGDAWQKLHLPKTDLLRKISSLLRK